MSSFKKRYEKKELVILSIMLLVFCVTKVIRGSNVNSSTNGGIWNYISLGYYPVFFLLLYKRKSFKTNGLFISLLIYATMAMLISIPTILTGSMNINSLYNLFMVPYSVVVLYCFYLASDDSVIPQRIIIIAFIICLIINLYNVIRFKIGGAERALASDIYFSLTLFPFCLLIVKNKMIKITCIVGMFLAAFISAKRTAFIAFVISIILYVIVVEHNKGSGAFRILKLLLVLLGVLLFLYYVSEYIDTYYNLGLYKRLNGLQEDGGGGRQGIYEQIFTAYLESPWYNKLFGHGMFETLNLCGFMAHDDFLEVLYDYGIIAFMSFVSFFLALFKKGVDLVRQKSEYAPSFVASIVIGLLLSLFSFMMVYFTYVTCISAFWGYVLGLENNNKRNELLGEDYLDGL